MATLAIINPKKRRKAKKASASKRVHKRASTHTRKRKRKVTRSRRRRSLVVTARASNPIRRKRRHARRRNPVMSGANLKGYLLPAITGAVGATVVDMLFDKFGSKLPVALQSGWGRYGALALIAIGAGWGLNKAKVLSPQSRNSLVMGSLVVTAYKAVTDQIVPMVSGGVATLPAPSKTTQGFQYGALAGFQPGTLAMVNSGMSAGMPTGMSVPRRNRSV